jgi:hypothetical protein
MRRVALDAKFVKETLWEPQAELVLPRNRLDQSITSWLLLVDQPCWHSSNTLAR